ncbi:hypothetical protein PT974_03947 [Cladobotryum mycophilum]|uniref:DSBA-like thioredoxin domain-containing protein n=1 Tax=Cladobotryum mycophilum TaxID=491253 RepID=A0ABR0STT5_9HYPO
MTSYDITIISDTVCPFCYLGRARLNRSIQLYKKTVPGGSSSTFNIRWHAYQLDRNASSTPVHVRDVAAQRFGQDRLPAKVERMAQLGASEGFNFTFDGKIGNSRDSHRVSHLGRDKGGADMEDRDLATAAERAGIPREETLEWLEEGKGGEEVDREVDEAVKMGVHGVPKFIIDGKYEVEGADDVTSFFEQMLKAKEDKEKVAE